jgi:glucose-6-phosphate 1-dehydrogenase
VFRVDHFLAMTTVRNMLGTRLANRMLEPIWTSAHIEEFEIVWDETLALEGRAGYYDRVGALSLGERDLRDRVDVLRSVRPLRADDVVARTRRARYRGYADEDGVAPGRGTETFAEVVLELDSWRWSGTRFRLRTGKALGRPQGDRRALPRGASSPVRSTGGAVAQPPAFGLAPEGLSLELTGTGPGATLSLVPVVMSAELQPAELPAYARILLDVLGGDATLSIRGDEAEEAWRIVAPVLEGWSRDLAPLEEYDPGSLGREGRGSGMTVTGGAPFATIGSGSA